MLTCKITLPDSPHPLIISKKTRILSTKKYFLNIFGCWLLSEKYSVCPKNNGFARPRGLQPPPQPPGSYAYGQVLLRLFLAAVSREIESVV